MNRLKKILLLLLVSSAFIFPLECSREPEDGIRDLSEKIDNEETVKTQVTVKIAVNEMHPYSGSELPDNGYACEAVKEAFRRQGYSAEFVFYPAKRSFESALEGDVDALMPIYYQAGLRTDFEFSDSFPGGILGLLKRKASAVKFGSDPRKNPSGALWSLRKYTFGAIDGAVYFPEFDNALFLKKDFADEDVQNIKKLDSGRIDLLMIDKYTAADVMVTEAPHVIGRLEFMKPAISERKFHLAFSKKSNGYGQKLAAFNAGFSSMVRDGKLDEILQKHGLFDLVKNTEKKYGKTKLTIASVDNPEMVVMRKLSKEYQIMNPDVEIDWRFMDENILRIRVMSDIALSDGRFDAVTIGTYETSGWAKKGWIQPFVNIPGNYDVKDILKPLREALSFNSILYALPFYCESSVTYFRKDVFEQHGLKMPENPTWNEIADFAAKIDNRKGNFYGIALRGKPGWGENIALITTMVNSYGGRWFDMNWLPQLESSEWKEALEMYAKLLMLYGPPSAEKNGYSENLDLFLQGRCAMWVDATVAAGSLYNPQISKVAGKVGIANAPAALTSKGSNWLWAWALAIPSCSPQKRKAEDFILWATSKKYVELAGEMEGWVSVPPGTRYSTYENSGYRTAAPFSEAVLEAILKAHTTDQCLRPVPYTGIQYVAIPEFQSFGSLAGIEISRILTKENTVEAALGKCNNLVWEQMKLSDYYK